MLSCTGSQTASARRKVMFAKIVPVNAYHNMLHQLTTDGLPIKAPTIISKSLVQDLIHVELFLLCTAVMSVEYCIVFSITKSYILLSTGTTMFCRTAVDLLQFVLSTEKF